MNIDEPQPLPLAFIDSHYCQHHLMHALGVDEPEFWAMYVSGLIPRGCSLMHLTGVPLIVWPKHVLDNWNAAGRPAEPGSLELMNEVLQSLIQAYRDAGAVFPDKLAEMN